MSVTSMFVVLLNSTATLVQYLATGTLPYDWALWFLGFSAIGAIIGKLGVDRCVVLLFATLSNFNHKCSVFQLITFIRLVRQFKMQSLIVFLLAVLIFITTVALIYIGAQRMATGRSTWAFKPLCSTNSTNTTDFGNVTNSTNF